MRRRELLRGGLAAGALGLIHCQSPKPEAREPVAPAKKPKSILILGGTGFLGPKTIAAAVARGHKVTIFNRGKREKIQPLEMSVEHLYGNRDPDLPADDEKGTDGKLLHPDGSPRGLEQLAGRSWDAVIDNSGYVPRMVGASAQLLAKNVSRYIFISSISAYADPPPPQGGDETSKLAVLTDPKVETMGPQYENYGGLKALCEQAAEAAMPRRTAIVRPGFIVGPGDPTDRFTYWPVHVAAGGEVLAPGSADDPLQWIDVRDLADWLVTLVENETTGTFNAIGPTKPARWGDVLQACVEAHPGAKLEWVSTAWLDKNAAETDDIPIWTPPTGKSEGFHKWSNRRAVAAGLAFRPVADTVKAILAWYPGEVERRVRVTRELVEAAQAKGQPPPKGDPTKLRAGLSPEREQELLAKWKASGGGL